MRIKKAFTLIELLIVIAIFAILTTILFPVFAKAREKARQASCVSNLKQIGNAIMMYNQDYNEMYPFEWGGPSGTIFYTTGVLDTSFTNPCCRFGSYQAIIYPYVKNFQVFMCPSSQQTTQENKFAYDYGMNAWIGIGWATDPVNIDSVSMATIKNPSGTLLVADTLGSVIDRPAKVATRHNEGAVIAFCDGHAKWMSRAGYDNNQAIVWPGI